MSPKAIHMPQDDGWLLTHSGHKIYILDPKPADICIEDVAWALSMTCRFGGHVRTFYSVADHSMRVATAVMRLSDIPMRERPQLALCALLHDATEAYLGDVIRPLKNVLPGYVDLEQVWARVIGTAFGVRLDPLPLLIKRLDQLILFRERVDLLTDGHLYPNQQAGFVEAEHHFGLINPLSQADSYHDFLTWYPTLISQISHFAEDSP